MATMSLDQTYLQLVTERDALRLVRDTQGLSAEQETELNLISQQFLDYRTEKAAIDHQRVAEVRQLMDGYRDRATIFLGGADMITADMVDFIKSDLVIFGTGILLFIIATLARVAIINSSIPVPKITRSLLIKSTISAVIISAPPRKIVARSR